MWLEHKNESYLIFTYIFSKYFNLFDSIIHILFKNIPHVFPRPLCSCQIFGVKSSVPYWMAHLHSVNSFALPNDSHKLTRNYTIPFDVLIFHPHPTNLHLISVIKIYFPHKDVAMDYSIKQYEYTSA